MRRIIDNRLDGRRILFIGSVFHGYCNIICDTMRKEGAFVEYFNSDEPSRICKILEKLCLHKIANHQYAKVINKRIDDIDEVFDTVFIIKGKYLNHNHFKIMRQKYKEARFVLYVWDSLINIKNWDVLRRSVDVIYSFDRIDCDKNNLILRPLFYVKKYEASQFVKYDLSFVGNFHSDRYEIIKDVINMFENQNVRMKFVIYIGKFYYLFYRYITHRIRKEDEKLFVTKYIPYNEYLEISMCSNVILDINHPSQSGLTMRTIESIGLGKKILTTNAEIEKYEEIDRQSVFVFDRKNPVIDVDFVKEVSTNKTNKEKFSLDSFISELLME